MSYHSKKLSLPSIQFLLEDPIPTSHGDNSFQHSNNKEYSTLPSELQQLSLSAPLHEHKRPSSANHSRSFSDLTAIKPLSFPPRSRYQTHRRSISANISTTVEQQQQQQQQHHHHHQQQQQQQQQQIIIERALTESPPISLKQLNESPQQRLLFDALNIDNLEVKRDEETGKYYCPFCQKSFNRPSSLKIHTYSHTGEKPFPCPIKGCGRQFSVQSNMRRHLKIHKKSKIKK